MKQLIVTLAILALPLVLSLLEQRQRREKAAEAMKKVRQRQNQRPPEPPRPKQSLADWIEEIKRKQDLDPSPPRGHQASDPLDEPRPGPNWEDEVEFEREGEDEVVSSDFREPQLRPRDEFVAPIPMRESQPWASDDGFATAPMHKDDEPEQRSEDYTSGRARKARRAQRAGRADREGSAKRGFDLDLELNSEDMRRAFVLREVLDKPLALRRRRPI